MSGFSADWLALREPADAAARSRPLTIAAGQALARSPAPIAALDLGTGSGSNVRYLSRYLRSDCEWLLVDDDQRLLQTLPSRLPGVSFQTMRADLAALAASGVLAGRRFVTASALLDLVSENWLGALASLSAGSVDVALFVLNYDGRLVLAPDEPTDVLVRDLVNRHQRTDKGFGPALGPDAARRAAALFREHGYDVTSEASDWVLTASQGELQRQLIVGWASAAREINAGETAAIERWRQRRLEHVDAGRSTCIVGHRDVLAVRR